MSIATEDVKEDSSPPQEREDIEIDGAPEPEVITPEATEVKEEVVQEEAPVETTDHRVPYSRLQKVIGKGKEKDDRIAELERQLTPSQSQEVALKRPTLADHDYDEAKHNAAMDQYETAKEKALLNQFDRLYDERTTKQSQQAQLDNHNKAFGDIHDKDPRLAQAVKEIMETEGGSIAYSDATRDALAASSNSAELEAYLTINRHDILPKLEGMSPVAQAMELGRISASLVAPQTQVQDKPISQAPEPIETSDGGSTFIDSDAARRSTDKTFLIE